MRPYRLILCLLALELAGCGDYEKDRLAKQNHQLSSTVEQLTKELQDYKTGAEANWQKEVLFRRDLDHAAACKLVFELPIMCPPALAAARQKVLAEANQKGIASAHGNQYWLTVALSACGLLLVMLAGTVGWLLLVDPTRTRIQERDEKLRSAQADLDKIHQQSESAEAELQRVGSQTRAARESLAKVVRLRELAVLETAEAQAEAELARTQAEDLKQGLKLLRAFKKS